MMYINNQYSSGNSEADSNFDHPWEWQWAHYYKKPDIDPEENNAYEWVVASNPY